MEPSALRSTLSALRRRGATILSLRELVSSIEARTGLCGPAVVFTVDDGYRDFLTTAAPIFANFDAPVTVFLTTRFVDGGFWCWWDRIEYAVSRSPRRSVALELDGGSVRVEWECQADRYAAIDSIAERLKRVPDAQRHEVLDRLGELLDVEIPAGPPPAFSAMSWDEVRRLEGAGVEFGPHSRSHPILSRIGDEAARDEIMGSWGDLRRECRSPVPVFCYPNGTEEDYGPREVRLVRDAGLRGALAVYRSYVTPAQMTLEDRFWLPRFPFPGVPRTALFQASGLARSMPRIERRA
jgi:peptidoglycan/xylan/chitin deacetylase (PgdA/CDA1 family)